MDGFNERAMMLKAQQSMRQPRFVHHVRRWTAQVRLPKIAANWKWADKHIFIIGATHEEHEHEVHCQRHPENRHENGPEDRKVQRILGGNEDEPQIYEKTAQTLAQKSAKKERKIIIIYTLYILYIYKVIYIIIILNAI